MTTNADRIAEWRGAHPTERLTARILLDILGLTTLRRADLHRSNLSGADLSWADLGEASLCGANLHGADLHGADLPWADLCGADLHGADLCGANLHGADLCGVNLYGAYLYGAMHEHIMPINAGASGVGALYPQADGWHVSIGCWRHHAPDELADLLADRINWPEAGGEERERRRPLLKAVHATGLAFIDQMPDDLIDRHAAARAEVTS